jgi:DNA-binding GntR family transcriptional regulator
MPTATRAEFSADILRQAIRDGAYPCGQRLIELHLATELNVSQNTIREALRLLEQEGWVIRHVRHGVYVREFTPDEAEEVYALWAATEYLAFGWAADRLNRVQLLTALRPLVEDARLCFNEGRWSAAREALFGFHGKIAALSQRTQAIAILTQLHNRAWLLDIDYEFNKVRSQQIREEYIGAYEYLIGVIKFDDISSAQQVLHDYILETGKPIIRWLAMSQ